MNDSGMPPQLRLEGQTPISTLTPDISDPASRVVRGIVTVTWPYNSVKNTSAFILAEPDYRLRRKGGQIRVNFTGPAARALGECGLGGNDEIYLSLDGAEWEPENARRRQSVPGAGVDWKLKFSDKLLLRANLGETGEVRVINVDHPVTVEPDQPIEESPAETSRLRNSPSPPFDVSALTPAKNNRLTKLNDEFASPAFLKRARLSYGSLFEDGYDIFEDDGGVRGRGRKRSRFGRKSDAWRYTTQSPSPEHPAASQSESEAEEEGRMSSPPRPKMTDEGCQTMELDMPMPVHMPVSTDLPSQKPQTSPPTTETVYHSQNGLVDQGVQAFPQNESPPAVPIANTRRTPAGTLQNATPDIHPFPTNHASGMVRVAFQQRWKTDTTESTHQVYIDDPVVHEQAANDSLLASPGTRIVDHQPSDLEDTRFGRLSHSTSRPENFAKDVGDRGHFTHDIEETHTYYSTPQASYPPLDATDDEEGRAPAATDVISNYPPDYLNAAGQSVPQHHMQTPPQSFDQGIRESLAPAIAEQVPTSWAAVNNNSKSTSKRRSDRLGSVDGQSPETPVVLDYDESDDNPAPAPSAVKNTLRNGRADTLEMYEDAEVEDEVDAMYSDVDKPEYDADEMGGDYDTRNYAGPDDDEDDGQDEDMRPHRLEPQFDDGESWDDETELEEEERRYQTDSEEDYDMDEDEEEAGEELERPAPLAPQAAPAVIDLISSDEDESDIEGGDGMLPQPPRAPTSLGRTNDSTLKARQSPEDDIVSQEEDDSEFEGFSVTSGSPEALGQDEVVQQHEEAEDVTAGEGSSDSEEELHGLSERDTPLQATTETTSDGGKQRGAGPASADEDTPTASHVSEPLVSLEGAKGAKSQESQNRSQPLPSDERISPPSQASEPSAIFKGREDVAGQGQRKQDVAPLTAAEGLETLSKTVNREEAEAKAGEKTDVSQAEPEELSILEAEDKAKESEPEDVEMGESNHIGDRKTITEYSAKSKVAEVERSEAKAVRGDKEPITTDDATEAVDLTKTTSEPHPEVQPKESRETPRDSIPAPSSPALTQSFPTEIESKPEAPIHESAISSRSQSPVDQLPTPLDSQLRDVIELHETTADAMPMDVDEPHEVVHRAAHEEPLVTASGHSVEPNHVHTVAVVAEAIEQRDGGHIEVQRQNLMVEEHVAESRQASRSPEPVPAVVFRSRAGIDNWVQARLREDTALDVDYSGVSWLFRELMEEAEELQASILEDNPDAEEPIEVATDSEPESELESDQETSDDSSLDGDEELQASVLEDYLQEEEAMEEYTGSELESDEDTSDDDSMDGDEELQASILENDFQADGLIEEDIDEPIESELESDQEASDDSDAKVAQIATELVEKAVEEVDIDYSGVSWLFRSLMEADEELQVSILEDNPDVEEPIEEPTEKPTREPLEEPIQRLIQEPVQEPIQEPVQEHVQEPSVTNAELGQRASDDFPMDSDEDLQASILEDESYTQGSTEWELGPEQRDIDDSDFETDEELQVSILKGSSYKVGKEYQWSPILGSDPATEFDNVQLEPTETEPTPEFDDVQSEPTTKPFDGIPLGPAESESITESEDVQFEPTKQFDDFHLEPTRIEPTTDFEEIQSKPTETEHTQRDFRYSFDLVQESPDEDSQLDPSVQLARAANAIKPRRKRGRPRLEDKRPYSGSQGVRKAQTPDEKDPSLQLARISLSSPSKAEDERWVEAKLQVVRHLRDELPEYPQLQILRYYIGQTVDVMAVSMMRSPEPRRAKGGPRHYMMAFNVADQSTPPSNVIEVQLYRPHKDALPVVKRGDVVLLRNFKVVALQGRGCGLRTGDESSWAVWDSAHGGPPQIRGPPVEISEKEALHAGYLREWFNLLSSNARAKLERASQKIINAAKNAAKNAAVKY
ncbi:hypothetical protein DL769_004716 [Monosporascus sp. CRB-8-3]|nr:hypothetical protein DL769_004716 [Monosporascus sp. CRB-8-3]